MSGLIVLAGIGFGVLLISLGIMVELRSRTPAPESALSLAPIQPADLTPGPNLIERFRAAAARHPAPAWAWIETAVWLVALLSLLNHFSDPRGSVMAQIIWYLTIGPHEIGHIICIPFGWTLQFAGGSIWQILWWALLAIWVFAFRQQVTMSLAFWTITGHSFINLAVYINDARARDLPLLFGMDSSHHDWWNLLNHFGMLEYDHTLAAIANITGAVIVVWAVLLGIISAWLLPRERLGPFRRYTGGYWAALKNALQPYPRPVEVVDFFDLDEV